MYCWYIKLLDVNVHGLSPKLVLGHSIFVENWTTSYPTDKERRNPVVGRDQEDIFLLCDQSWAVDCNDPVQGFVGLCLYS